MWASPSRYASAALFPFQRLCARANGRFARGFLNIEQLFSDAARGCDTWRVLTLRIPAPSSCQARTRSNSIYCGRPSAWYISLPLSTIFESNPRGVPALEGNTVIVI